MTAVEGWSVAAVVVLLAVSTEWVHAQSEAPDNGAGGLTNETRSSGFIEPNELDDDVDQFTRDQKEYLVVNRKRKFRNAILTCQDDFNGDLAVVDTSELANFLAEALAETNLLFDALWVAGQKQNDTWLWIRGNSTAEIDPSIVNSLSNVSEVAADNRNCVAFARLDHDKPDYRALACNAERAVLCERPRGASGGNSSHPGWIRVGDRLYKIFAEMIPYDEASAQCFKRDRDSQLAVVPSLKEAKTLGRYLLIGRPSLENAWIGARFFDDSYRFEPEPIVLDNQTSGEGYPPWRNNHIKKAGGCVLLDRHLADTTLFVEARCERNRAYICYKFANESRNANNTDVIFDDNAYRLVFSKKIWTAAKEHCENTYKEYGSYLVEITSPIIKSEVLYVMGENTTAVHHIWIGGVYNPAAQMWTWDHSKGRIATDEPMNWVQNTTYDAEVEADNVCLNMDRENHLAALHYGTSCNTPQFFICFFTPENLRKLEQDEREEYQRKMNGTM